MTITRNLFRQNYYNFACHFLEWIEGKAQRQPEGGSSVIFMVLTNALQFSSSVWLNSLQLMRYLLILLSSLSTLDSWKFNCCSFFIDKNIRFHSCAVKINVISFSISTRNILAVVFVVVETFENTTLMASQNRWGIYSQRMEIVMK